MLKYTDTEVVFKEVPDEITLQYEKQTPKVKYVAFLE